MTDRIYIEVLREQLQAESDPVTRKLIEAKIARREKDNGTATCAAKLPNR